MYLFEAECDHTYHIDIGVLSPSLIVNECLFFFFSWWVTLWLMVVPMTVLKVAAYWQNPRLRFTDWEGKTIVSPVMGFMYDACIGCTFGHKQIFHECMRSWERLTERISLCLLFSLTKIWSQFSFLSIIHHSVKKWYVVCTFILTTFIVR